MLLLDCCFWIVAFGERIPPDGLQHCLRPCMRVSPQAVVRNQLAAYTLLSTPHRRSVREQGG